MFFNIEGLQDHSNFAVKVKYRLHAGESYKLHFGYKLLLLYCIALQYVCQHRNKVSINIYR